MLPWINKVSNAFVEKTKSVANSLYTEFMWLMFVMGFETGWTYSPTAQNPNSTAVGLIQFLESTAAWLGTTTAALRAMSAEDQLYWVQKYLEAMKKQYGRFSSYHDLYFAVFYPYAISQPDEYVIGSQEGAEEVQTIALRNKGFDLNNNNQVTKAEVKQWLDGKVRQNFPEEYWNDFFKKKMFCSYIKQKLSLAA